MATALHTNPRTRRSGGGVSGLLHCWCRMVAAVHGKGSPCRPTRNVRVTGVFAVLFTIKPIHTRRSEGVTIHSHILETRS